MNRADKTNGITKKRFVPIERMDFAISHAGSGRAFVANVKSTHRGVVCLSSITSTRYIVVAVVK